MQACETCKAYVHTVNLVMDKQAIADVDELAGLPLDVWARGKGYRKLRTSLLGI